MLAFSLIRTKKDESGLPCAKKYRHKQPINFESHTYTKNKQYMQISVVIPTYNRKSRLLALLESLNRSSYPVFEIIIVDSGEENLTPADYGPFENLNIHYVKSEKSVCIQRNTGIKKAVAPWIFLCDDDIEVPADYLQKLMDHIAAHPETGAVSGLVLQLEKAKWTAQYPVYSARVLLWKFIFQLGIWGSLDSIHNNFLLKKIKAYYKQKGNHISKAGWPVVIDFSGDYFITPIYGLGASLVKREWLMNAPYDEVLDTHGIGDNYGVAIDFPDAIHIINNAFVYHHRESENRLQQPLQYFRRVLAIDYFRKTKKKLLHVRKFWLLWSLTANLMTSIIARNPAMIKATFISLLKIFLNKNPYYIGCKAKEKIIEPTL